MVGAQNLLLGTASFDLVHCLWPEELCYNRTPSDPILALAADRLQWWSQRSTIIFSVNNAYPHGFENDSRYHRLYDLFYKFSDGIHHFSRTSMETVNRRWPTAAAKPFCILPVGTMNACFVPVRIGTNCRRELTFAADDFVILIFWSVAILGGSEAN